MDKTPLDEIMLKINEGDTALVASFYEMFLNSTTYTPGDFISGRNDQVQFHLMDSQDSSVLVAFDTQPKFEQAVERFKLPETYLLMNGKALLDAAHILKADYVVLNPETPYAKYFDQKEIAHILSNIEEEREEQP